MGRQMVDADGICTDYKNMYCGICNRLNTAECCRAVPKYQKKINSWNRKMKKVSGEVTGITLAIGALTSIREKTLGKLSGSDLDRVEKLVELAKRKPGFGIRFMHDGVEHSCFDCVHCDKSFREEPCHKCLGGAERGVKQLFEDDMQFEHYEYASNFEPKAREKEIAIQELVEKHISALKSIEKDATAKGVSMYEILAHLLSTFCDIE